MTAPPGDVPRRHRYPSRAGGNALIVYLAAIAATIAVGAVVLGILLYFELGAQVDELDRVARAACRDRENLKADVRVVLEGFKIDPAALPRGKDGTVAFSPRSCQ